MKKKKEREREKEKEKERKREREKERKKCAIIYKPFRVYYIYYTIYIKA